MLHKRNSKGNSKWRFKQAASCRNIRGNRENRTENQFRKLEKSQVQRVFERILKFAWRKWCLLTVILTLSGARHPSHQPSQQNNTQICKGVVGGQYRRLYRNPHGEWRNVQGVRKCQRHPSRPRQYDRISTRKRPPTTATVSESRQLFGRIKYTRYLNCFTGKSVIVTDLGTFSPIGGT